MTRKNLGQVGSPSWPKRYLKRSRGLWSKRMDDPDFEAMFGKEVRGYPEVEGLQAQLENFAWLGFQPSILQNCVKVGFKPILQNPDKLGFKPIALARRAAHRGQSFVRRDWADFGQSGWIIPNFQAMFGKLR